MSKISDSSSEGDEHETAYPVGKKIQDRRIYPTQEYRDLLRIFPRQIQMLAVRVSKSSGKIRKDFIVNRKSISKSEGVRDGILRCFQIRFYSSSMESSQMKR